MGLYSVGAFAAIIAVLGVLANTLYAETGGYGVGFALVAVCAFAAGFLFSFSTPLARVRSKGLLIFSFGIVFGYLILFILADLAYVPAMTFNFDGSKYLRELKPLGTVALVFEIICMLILLFEAIRLLANLFGKEFYRYESILGTPAARRAEGEVAAEELPRKDTAKLFAEADAAYLRAQMTVTELTRAENAPSPSDKSIPEAVSPVVEEPIPSTETPVPEVTEEVKTETTEDTPVLEESAPIVEDGGYEEVEIAESVNNQVESVIDNPDYNEISSFNSGYAQDVRQDYIPTRTIQKENDDEDDIYTDFTYDGKK